MFAGTVTVKCTVNVSVGWSSTMSQTDTGCSFHRPSFLTRLRMYDSGSSTQRWLVIPPHVWSIAGWFGLSWLSIRR